MKESIEQNKIPEQPEARFDKEKEKEHRKEIRKSLDRMFQKTLSNIGFRKVGGSTWGRKVGDRWELVFLQRSQFSHIYYVEIGVCEEKDIPEDWKPHVAFCKEKDQKRIEGVVEEIDGEREERDLETQSMSEQYIRELLEFEAPGYRDQHPGEHYIPSVKMEEAEQKVENIQQIISEYIPAWFEQRRDTETERA